MEEPVAKPLMGRTIAVPEMRDLEFFAATLEALGARVIRCPLVSIIDTPDQASVECWLHELVDDSFNDVVLLTGEGARKLFECARRIGIYEKAVAALAKTRKITRGPKPAKALVEAGLKPDYAAAAPTTAGVIETLKQFDLSGRHIGVQLYGDNPNQVLIDFILDEGAHPEPVSPYTYAPAAHDDAVKSLIDEMAAGHVDVLAFTSAPQVRRLAEIAEKFALKEKLTESAAKTRFAAVGPVVGEEISKQGWTVSIMPKSSFIWKQLVNEIVATLAKR